ncbi:MAG: mechanosensitive ion channel [Dinoroseobacter sp.]|nr:mechanosensitive ion channel [Dinoroseobacter sp.]
MRGQIRLNWTRVWIIAALLVIIQGSSAPVVAQSTFPIPGLSGQQSTEPSTDAPEDPATQAPSQAAQDLINILRDPAAREALIQELETGTTEVAPETQTAPAPPAVADPADANIGERLLRWLRDAIVNDLRSFVVRVQQIPYNTQLALRAFDQDLISRVISDIGGLVLVSYGSLTALRIVSFPLLIRVARTGNDKPWLAKLVRRGLLSFLQIAPIFLASFATAYWFAATNPEGEATQIQINYLGAFIVVELVRAGFRFFLSPRSPELRFLPIPDAGAKSLQTFATISIVFLGYGQLVLAAAVADATSVFVGRAFSSFLGIFSVLYVIVVVLVKRHDVARWLRRNESEGTLDQTMGALAERWHMPVLLYLFVLLLIVSTNTGNVLLPLMTSTLEFLVILFVGYTAASMAQTASMRRLRLPAIVTSNLPMLETRLNQLVPAFFTIVRIVILIAVLVFLVGSFAFFEPVRIFSTTAGSAFLSGLVGVVVVGLIAVLIYLSLASWVDYKLNPFVGEAPTPRMITLLTLMRNALTILLVVVAIMLSLSQLGVDIGPLLAGAGVLGLAISFGAQRMVEDIITGLFIQLENAMNVGDVVDVGGVVGTVEKLTVRSVTLRDVKGVVHMIPFSSANMISNYMRDFSYYVCDMGVAYRENIDDVKIAMYDAFEELQKDQEQARFILADLEWFGLNMFDASAIVLRARIKTAPGKQWGVGRAYNGILKRVFDERGIEIPFPHQTLYFGEDRKGNAPPVQVVLHTSEPEASKASPVSKDPPENPDEPPKPTTLDTPDGPEQA